MGSSIFSGIVLPVALATIMLGMGLSLVLEDFQRITRYPTAVAVGTVCQVLLLPLIGVLITQVVPMQPAIAVGLIIVAICPGGPSSNLLTYLAKGDVALSVTLTALSSLITVFTIPIFANLALQHFLGQNAAITLPVGQTMLQIFLILLLPTAIGMAIRHQFPHTALRLEKQMSRLAMGIMVMIIVLILVQAANKLPVYLAQVGMGVVLLNLLGMLIGFLAGTLFRLPLAQQICIAIEVGIQNGALALTITAGLLNNPNMAIPAVAYSLWMYVTSFGAVLYSRKAKIRAANSK